MSNYKDEQLEKKLEAIEDEMDDNEMVADTQRVAVIAPPEQPCYYDEWQYTIDEHFPELRFAAEICLSVITQLLINDVHNPFAVVLVDVPSAGKTIGLNFFAEIDDLTYATDKFTPASFVSNAANVKKKNLAKIDLLPRIKNKTLIVRDFATVFSKRDDDLNELLGTMTRVLDGEGFNADSGVHGQRHYVGEYLFMMLAASTPIPPKVWKMMGNLGSRLFFLNLNSSDKSEDELADQLGSTTYKDHERACRAVTHRLLETLWSDNPDGVDWQSDQDDRELKLMISRCAKLLASLRGVVNTYTEYGDGGKPELSHSIPVVEKPDRINQLLYNLCRGHALACGRRQIVVDDVRYAIELAIDSAPTERAKIFSALLKAGGTLSTSDIESLLNCSKPTALKEMERLRVLKLCTVKQESQGLIGEPEKTIHLSDSLTWFMSDECRTIRGIDKGKMTLCSATDQAADDLERITAVFGPVEPVDDTSVFPSDAKAVQEKLV